MNKNHIDVLQQGQNTETTLNRWSTAWSTDLAVAKGVQMLRGYLTPLEVTRKAGLHRSKPVTKGKRGGMEKFKKRVLWIGGVLCLYAKDTGGNPELKEVAFFYRSHLDRLRQEDLVALAVILLEKAQQIGYSVLVDYGLDQAKIQEFQALTVALTELIRLPRYTVAQLKTMNAEVPKILKELRELLMVELRNLLTPYKESHPQFWLEYEASLNVINTGSIKTGEKPAEKPKA